MKIKLIILIFICALVLISCGKEGNKNYKDATLDIEGNIVIDEKDITETATFINYDADGVIIQLIAVKATDGTTRVALNTCQACNPSPKAYFVQEGEYLVCQVCGNKFHIDEVGIKHGGCNPTPVLEKKESDNEITISKDYIISFKDKFEKWKGITK